MTKTTLLENGETVAVNIPFTYTIGETGATTGKILRTIEDCENEVRAEVVNIDVCNMWLDSAIH